MPDFREKNSSGLTYLVIKLWQLSFHFVPLEEMILSLLTHWWNEIELPGHRVCLLILMWPWRKNKWKKLS